MSNRYIRLRWTGFSLLAGAFVLGFFHRIAPGVVAPDLIKSFGISAAALGSLAGVYYYVYTALQIPAGIVADTLGPRHVVSVAMLVAAAGSILFGLADSFGVATVGRLLVGLGVSFSFVGLMKFNTLWFEERRFGFISGLTLLIGNAGAVLAATPLALLLEVTGWREVFVGAGIFGIALGLAIALLLRNRPTDVGLPPVESLGGQPAHRPSERHWSRELYGALTNPHVWPGFLLSFGVIGAILAFVGLWCVPLLVDVHGLGRAEASGYATVILLGSAAGSFFVGGLSDQLGRRKPLAVASAALALACWLALINLPWQPGPSAYLLFGLLGLCAGGGTIAYAVAKEVAPPLFAGMAIAVVNTGLFLGAAVAQPAFGWAMDLSWDGTMAGPLRQYQWLDYRNGLSLCAGLALLGLLASLLLKETRCKNINWS